MNVYVIVEQSGLGLQESPYSHYHTPYVYAKKEDALKKSNELWLKNTTEHDRKSGWCSLHYIVKEITVR